VEPDGGGVLRAGGGVGGGGGGRRGRSVGVRGGGGRGRWESGILDDGRVSQPVADGVVCEEGHAGVGEHAP
jgi:hypothetical protein